MLAQLDFLTRFWELKARHASLGEPLSQREQQELLEMLEMLSFVEEEEDRVENARGERARLAGEGSSVQVRVREITASGIVVDLDGGAMPRGLLILFVADAIRGVEYVFPCTLKEDKSRASFVTLAPAGVPYKNRFESDSGDNAFFDDEDSAVRRRDASPARRLGSENGSSR